MNIFYYLIAIISIILTVLFVLLIKRIAVSFKVFDYPDKKRKIHSYPVPLLGGVAVFLSFFIMLFLVRDKLLAGDLEYNHWLGFFIGAVWLVWGGILDDKYNLPPRVQIIFPVLAALSVVLGGVSIEKISNPFGGFIFLDSWQVSIFTYQLSIVSAAIIFAWLLGMMQTTKLLDGVDGLVSGVTMIGATIIFLFTMTTRYYQPDIGLAALILAACSLGFLVFNWHPAKIFLGESGSLFLGFALGVLAIISGGKIAIALLVMGIPILDVAWTIVRRIKAGQNPFSFADRKHLHFRLIDMGFSKQQTVLIYYILATIFGLSALFMQGLGKLFALALLLILMLSVIAGFTYLEKKRRNQ